MCSVEALETAWAAEGPAAEGPFEGGTGERTADSKSVDETELDATAEGKAEAEVDDEVQDEEEGLDVMTPAEIVEQLDRFIIGQKKAKESVAIALRNRWRRHRLPADFKDEVLPKNILMVGPTGVGKTEIARRLAKLSMSPYVKVEATKFTEVGFHGKDVDQIIKDLVENGISMMRERIKRKNRKKIRGIVEDRILKSLVGHHKKEMEKWREHLREGLLEDQMIDVELQIKEADPSNTDLIIQMQRTGKPPPTRTRMEKKRMKISEARPIIEEMELESQTNKEDIPKMAVEATETDGIVFIDEIDKVCTPPDSRFSGDASSEGVQRDLLPIIEGCTISTNHGNVKTDHILFICSGAFSASKPSDLLAELQGRLPLKVEMSALDKDDFYRILTEPDFNLLRQQVELMKTEGVELTFEDDAIWAIARVSQDVNSSVEDIGARRLHTVIERIMAKYSFDAPALSGTSVTITANDVETQYNEMMFGTSNLKKFII